MKKTIISSLLLLTLILALAYNIKNTKDKIFSFFKINEDISKLVVINKNFDLFIQNNKSYYNFDIIQKKMIDFISIQKNIHKNRLINNNDTLLNNNIKLLDLSINQKFKLLNKIKSYRAVINNSFRIIQKIYKNNSNHINYKINDLYINILLIDKLKEKQIIKQLENVNKLHYDISNKFNKYFLLHSKIIFEYKLKMINSKLRIKNLNLNHKLEKFNQVYKEYSKNKIKKAQLYIIILITILLILIIAYLLHERELFLVNKKLSKFRLTLEDSDSIVMITDKEEKIRYVNDAFENISKYKKEEVIGKKPSFLKSPLQSDDFYKNIKNIIHSGKKWNGQFINQDKEGNIYYEKATITPSFDDKGNIEEFICIKLDITKEILIEKELKDKEKLLVEQSKLSAMGEMIGNIAHQWRQPLSVITAGSTGIQLQCELNMLNCEFIESTCNNINKNAKYLSQTIDDFKNFIKGDKNKEYFNLNNNMNIFLNLIDPLIKDYNINLNLHCPNDIELNSYSNELNQCLLNIVNNSIDILKEKDENIRKIFIVVSKNKNNIIITIKDTGGGINNDIINKIFEPYFTTKHKSVGTGLGLSMTHNIIFNSLGGTIKVSNTNFKYKDIQYKGAMFTINLPI